jgi:hypothetical protein
MRSYISAQASPSASPRAKSGSKRPRVARINRMSYYSIGKIHDPTLGSRRPRGLLLPNDHAAPGDQRRHLGRQPAPHRHLRHAGSRKLQPLRQRGPDRGWDPGQVSGRQYANGIGQRDQDDRMVQRHQRAGRSPVGWYSGPSKTGTRTSSIRTIPCGFRATTRCRTGAGSRASSTPSAASGRTSPRLGRATGLAPPNASCGDRTPGSCSTPRPVPRAHR